MPGQHGSLKSRKRKSSSEVKSRRKVCVTQFHGLSVLKMGLDNCLKLTRVKYILSLCHRYLLPGGDVGKAQRHTQQQRAVPQSVVTAKQSAPWVVSLASAASATSPLAGGDAQRHQSSRDRRAKRTSWGRGWMWTAADWTAPGRNRSTGRWIMKKLAKTSSQMTTATRFCLWSSSLETWILYRWGICLPQWPGQPAAEMDCCLKSVLLEAVPTVDVSVSKIQTSTHICCQVNLLQFDLILLPHMLRWHSDISWCSVRWRGLSDMIKSSRTSV